MTAVIYRPTEEQKAIIEHDGHAFIRACPGSGKTRTMVERARFVLSDLTDRRGVAFLSFTNAAVEELEVRLRSFGILPSPLFPSFIGTFDRFLWQFFIAPFGFEGCSENPKLIPDKSDWRVQPFDCARSLELKYFDRETGALLVDKAMEVKFSPKNGPGAWETTARKMIASALRDGKLDFEDVRSGVTERLADSSFSSCLGAALSGRFKEIIVDEAQDCNPADLKIIEWLRSSGIKVKVVCDPNQAIYAFRGGLTDELVRFEEIFDNADRLPMSGNFRSSPAICSAISQLRPPVSRGTPDKPIGQYADDKSPVYILSYSGAGVPAAIGTQFQKMVEALGISPTETPVLASTWDSAGKAAGRCVVDPGNDKTLLLAEAVMGFHSAFVVGNRRDALTRLHRVVLQVRGEISDAGAYSLYISNNELEDGRWRPDVITIGHKLKVKSGEKAKDWLERARTLLGSKLIGASSINQRLKYNKKLAAILVESSPTLLPASAIHAVKGMQFPAVCVVLTTKKAGTILDVLAGVESRPVPAEDARKIYVAASRAERFLAIAAPKSRVSSLKKILDAGGHPAQVVVIQK